MDVGENGEVENPVPQEVPQNIGENPGVVETNPEVKSTPTVEDLHVLYQDGKLKDILGNIRTLTHDKGSFLDGEMIAALEKYGVDPDSLDPTDQRVIELLGRLYEGGNKIDDASERFQEVRNTQRAADERQQQVEEEGVDPIDLKFDKLDLDIEKKFKEKLRQIDATFVDRYKQKDDPRVIKEHEESVVRSKETFRKLIDRNAGERGGLQTKLEDLMKQDQNDFRVLKQVKDVQDDLVHLDKELERFTAALEGPSEDRETYWARVLSAQKHGAIREAHLSLIKTGGSREAVLQDDCDRRVREKALSNSSNPELRQLYESVARRHFVSSAEVEAYYHAPVLDIMLRNKVEKALETNDPRLVAYDEKDGKRVTGKVLRILEAYEQSKEAEMPIKLEIIRDLLTPEEVKQVDEYFKNLRNAKAQQSAEEQVAA